MLAVGEKLINFIVKAYVHSYSWGILGHIWVRIDHEADAPATTKIYINFDGK